MKSNDRRRRRIPGPLWLVGGLLCTNFTVVGVTLYLAHSDPTFAVEPDYYGKAIRWEQDEAARERARVLGWSLEIDAAGAMSATGMRTLTMRLRDAEGEAVSGGRVEVECFSHLDASHRFSGVCAERGPGIYQVDVPLLGEGLHEVRATVRARGESVAIVSAETWAGVK